MGLRWRVGAPAGYCMHRGGGDGLWSLDQAPAVVTKGPGPMATPACIVVVARIASTKDENSKRKAHEGPSYPDYALTGPSHRSHHGPRRRPRGPRYVLAHGMPERAQQPLSGLGAVHELNAAWLADENGTMTSSTRPGAGSWTPGRACGPSRRSSPST